MRAGYRVNMLNMMHLLSYPKTTDLQEMFYQKLLIFSESICYVLFFIAWVRRDERDGVAIL